MTKITLPKALKLLERAVAEKGADYTVDLCRYFDDGEPACIVGHVFSYVGATEGDLHMGYDAHQVASANTAELRTIDVQGVKITPKAREVLSAAQQAQDRGKTWGNALKSARKVAEELRA